MAIITRLPAGNRQCEWHWDHGSKEAGTSASAFVILSSCAPGALQQESLEASESAWLSFKFVETEYTQTQAKDAGVWGATDVPWRRDSIHS